MKGVPFGSCLAAIKVSTCRVSGRGSNGVQFVHVRHRAPCHDLTVPSSLFSLLLRQIQKLSGRVEGGGGGGGKKEKESWVMRPQKCSECSVCACAAFALPVARFL